MNFSRISAVILDMDGVLWRGETPMPGLDDTFAWLDERGIPCALLTNNSGKTQAQYVEKLARMGVHSVPERQILTSAIATADDLAQHYPAGTRVYVVGMDGVRIALDAAGFDVVGEGEPADVVVAGIDVTLTYAKIKHAADLVRAGAPFIGTNGDLTFPAADGLNPGAGTVLAAIQAASGTPPRVIGKPARPMFESALRLLGVPAERALMVGDRLDTDIAGAQQAGLQTALVLSGVTTPDLLASASVWPDVAYEHLAALVRAWAGDAWMTERARAKRNSAR
ncbi:MAG: HAD-IIA family hydrolase [Chloroflexi bacterium]|nr:HAD-IIA family hydrolase [Chloroflexota bacterium]